MSQMAQTIGRVAGLNDDGMTAVNRSCASVNSLAAEIERMRKAVGQYQA